MRCKPRLYDRRGAFAGQARRARRSVVLLLLLLPPAAPAAAEDPLPLPAGDWEPRRHVCARTTAPIVIDGRLDESAWRAAPWTDDFVDIAGTSRPAPRLRTRAKLLWDDAALYVAAELEEPHLWATYDRRDAVIYHENDFEVFLDPDGDSHLYYELEINALGTEWDLLLVRPYRDGGPAVHAWDIPGLKTAVALDGTLNDPGDADAGWTVEMAFPWPALAECAGREVPPRPGDVWRVNFSRVQWRLRVEDGRYVKETDPATGRSLAEDNWVWSPQGLVAMHYPELWGFVLFSDAPAGGEPADFDLPDLERARWSLRQVYYAQRRHRAARGGWAPDWPTLAAALPELGVTVAPAPAPGWSWPPAVTATAARFEATLAAPDGRVLAIDEEGRCR